MTKAISGQDLGSKINPHIPGAIVGAEGNHVVISHEYLQDVAKLLRHDPDLFFDYLVAITAVDYVDFFEILYRLVSIRHNHSAVVKVQVFSRNTPELPSLVGIWRGADLQEREIYDLMGVRFEGHPNMKRIMLWEGFDGHPLRKDFLLQRP